MLFRAYAYTYRWCYLGPTHTPDYLISARQRCTLIFVSPDVSLDVRDSAVAWLCAKKIEQRPHRALFYKISLAIVVEPIGNKILITVVLCLTVSLASHSNRHHQIKHMPEGKNRHS